MHLHEDAHNVGVVVAVVVRDGRVVDGDIFVLVAFVGLRGRGDEAIKGGYKPLFDTHGVTSLNSEHSSSYISRASV
jgi:hypothetical protein